LRLISWNAYVGSKKTRTFAECYEYLRPLHADVIVLSEGPMLPAEGVWAWPAHPGAPKLQVWVAEEYTIQPIPVADAAPGQSGLFTIAGPVSFTLSAIWPVQDERGPRYSRLLADTLSLHTAALSGGQAILAGDLNSSPGVSGQAASHRKFVERMSSAGLVSAYHSQEGVEHGAESTGTLRRGKLEPKQYHIDYCFVSRALSPAATLAIIKNEEWSSRSDHWPLVLDIPNTAFRAAAP